MSEYLAFPPVREARGSVRVPASKSATNRAFLLAALGAEPVEIVRPLESDDVAAISRCLAAMGATIETAADGDRVRVSGPLGADPARRTVLDASDSGTAARFLTAVAASVPGRFTLTGSPRLRERPVEDLVTALLAAGARIGYAGPPGFLPLEIEGGTLRSGADVRVDAARSGQFLSALLIAGAAVDGGLTAAASGPVASEPYVGLTAAMLREFGHRVEEADGVFRVARGRTAISRYEPPGDWSSAIPLLAAAAIAGGEVRVEGLAWPSADADAAAVGVLEGMGVAISREKGAVSASASRGNLRAVAADASNFPDAVPALAACAAFAAGESRFRGIGHLRIKESDRIDALVAILHGAGVDAAGEADALVVRGGTLRPGGSARRLPTRNDHRMAMAAGLLALAVPDVLIESPRCVAKSYPGFWRDLDGLAARTP